MSKRTKIYVSKQAHNDPGVRHFTLEVFVSEGSRLVVNYSDREVYLIRRSLQRIVSDDAMASGGMTGVFVWPPK